MRGCFTYAAICGSSRSQKGTNFGNVRFGGLSTVSFQRKTSPRRAQSTRKDAMTKRLTAALLLGALTLLSAAQGHAEDKGAGRREVINALLALNNYIDAVRFSDACTGRADMNVLASLTARIDVVRNRVAVTLPDQADGIEAGDTDYTCDRSAPRRSAKPGALRRHAARLLDRLEAALAALPSNDH
jgi:hypothetical protein